MLLQGFSSLSPFSLPLSFQQSHPWSRSSASVERNLSPASLPPSLCFSFLFLFPCPLSSPCQRFLSHYCSPSLGLGFHSFFSHYLCVLSSFRKLSSLRLVPFHSSLSSSLNVSSQSSPIPFPFQHFPHLFSHFLSLSTLSLLCPPFSERQKGAAEAWKPVF